MMLRKIVLTVSLWMKSCSVTLIQMKAIEQFFLVILFIMLYKVVLTFGSVDKTIQINTTEPPPIYLGLKSVALLSERPRIQTPTYQ